ncbi:MAG: hypothetical protein JWO42_2256, partial [Chloroflexi bacterium]|nr:hypothetical protein [Chloroflexota bacterium]
MTAMRAARRPSPVAAMLAADGVIARNLPGYEQRAGQIEMAEMVLRAITRGEHAVVEAGTGTGKSMAYLVPAIYSGKTVIISTANKALQEQLIRKDIPFLQRVLPIPFDAAIVKGRGNYVCLDRYRDEEAYQQLIGGGRGWKRLAEWKDQTESGDFDDLDVALPNDLRGRVMSTTRTCVGQVCDLYEVCFVETAYQKAEASRIIVCNHALLLADLHLRDLGAHVLPDRDAIIIDEAHHLEDAAINALIVQLGPTEILELLENALIKRHVDASLLDRASLAGKRLADEIRHVCGPYQRIILEPLPAGEAFADLVVEMSDAMSRTNPYKATERTKEARRYTRVLEWLRETASTARLVAKVHDQDSVRYSLTSEGGRDRGAAVRWSPIDVSRQLNELLFGRYPTICTSATLATAARRDPDGELEDTNSGPGPFDYFRSRVGCEEARESVIPSPFDFYNQCLLYVARTMPEFSPHNQEAYTQALAVHLERLVTASRGRAFCLFTSYKMLDRVYELLAGRLEFPLLRQGEAPRPELLRRFRRDKGSVLFATRSFWEGVDV